MQEILDLQMLDTDTEDGYEIGPVLDTDGSGVSYNC